ncbi:MAG: hypothetical protein GXY61_01985 [Lentisphaerae bacterium]|nr:hypothetical protein [Lentisphaerota bacterium]
MKKSTLIIASTSVLLLLSGCGKSPIKIAKAFSESLAKGNITQAKECATEEFGLFLDMAASLGTIEAVDPDYKFVLVKETINGNHAVVQQEGRGQIDLVKIDGEWKVDYADLPTSAESAAKANIEMLSIALWMYHMYNGSYPSELEGLLDSTKEGYPFLVVKKIPTDPWGNSYQYVVPGNHNPTDFDLWALGHEKVRNWD